MQQTYYSIQEEYISNEQRDIAKKSCSVIVKNDCQSN